MKKNRFYLSMCTLLLAFALTACGNANHDHDHSDSTNTGEPVAVHDAVPIYEKSCVSCHATDLSGGMGPSLQNIGSTKSEEEIRAIIREGSGAMPGFKNSLDEQEINLLSSWLSSQEQGVETSR